MLLLVFTTVSRGGKTLVSPELTGHEQLVSLAGHQNYYITSLTHDFIALIGSRTRMKIIENVH